MTCLAPAWPTKREVLDPVVEGLAGQSNDPTPERLQRPTGIYPCPNKEPLPHPSAVALYQIDLWLCAWSRHGQSEITKSGDRPGAFRALPDLCQQAAWCSCRGSFSSPSPIRSAKTAPTESG